MTQKNLVQKRKKALKLAGECWRKCHAQMRRLDPNINVKPSKAEDLFEIDYKASDKVRLIIKPVVIWTLVKRAGSKKPRVYIVLSGAIDFDATTISERPVAEWFSTQIGYFCVSGRDVEHVCGAHYDFDPRTAHPVFHTQLTSQTEMWHSVTNHFDAMRGHSVSIDHMNSVMSNVRFPTAQMDFFSVLLQVCSDHMINETSAKLPDNEQPGKTNLDLYNEVCEAVNFFSGYGEHHRGLRAGRDASCARSPYWYSH